jgi:hypothetical protein
MPELVRSPVRRDSSRELTGFFECVLPNTILVFSGLG